MGMGPPTGAAFIFLRITISNGSSQAEAVQLVDLGPDQPAAPVFQPWSVGILRAMVEVPPFAPILRRVEISDPSPDREHLTDMLLHSALGIGLTDYKMADAEMV